MTTGQLQTAVGFQALKNNTGDTYCTAIGARTLQSNTTGTSNFAGGDLALNTNTTGSSNVAVGSSALQSSTTASNNVAIGTSAGAAVTTGVDNTLIGHQAGYYTNSITTGADNVIVGAYSATAAASNSGSIVIGRFITGKGTNTGIISPGGSGAMYNGANTTTCATTSDQRLKKNIADNNDGLDKINSIRVRNFEYRLPEEVNAELAPTDAIKKSGVQLGVIAQELQQVLPECVKQESTGVLSVDTDNLTWYLINAVKQLSAEVESLKSQLKGN
jgi:hypothetical protein